MGTRALSVRLLGKPGHVGFGFFGGEPTSVEHAGNFSRPETSGGSLWLEHPELLGSAMEWEGPLATFGQLCNKCRRHRRARALAVEYV